MLKALKRERTSSQSHDQRSDMFSSNARRRETNLARAAALKAQQSNNQASTPSGLSKI
jgi:hypothetical protein